MSIDKAKPRLGAAGIAWRIGAAAGLVSLSVLSTVRGASGAFEGASTPVANLAGQNGMVSGVTRMMGNRFLLYNGTRLESMAQSMEVNFERGGSMVMCPRSQLQILTANQNSGIMLAFQSGGAQQPFPMRMGDEVLTPDWRVELTSDVRKGDMGIVQVVTNRHGDLCMQGNLQAGAYLHVSQLIGDESFRVAGGPSTRFVDGRMETSGESCGCNAEFASKTDGDAGSNAVAMDAKMVPDPSYRAMAAAQAAPVSASAAQAGTATAAGSDAGNSVPDQKKKRPQDVAGYVGIFVHKLFGR